MNKQIPNIMSLDDHVIKINLAKNKVKNSIFEMAEAITNALNQLENSQVELAQKLGMSRGTLSKWHSIGSNNNIMEIRELAPPSFDSLYQLSVLDNHYHKYYGKENGGRKFVKLFKNKIITPLSQRNDINKIIKLHKQKLKLKNTETKVLDHTKFNSEIKLGILVKSKLHFNTIIISPSDNQINKWKNLSSIEDINFDYPIRSLKGINKNIFQQCLMKVKAKYIDISVNCLNSWGYNYDKIMVPKQPRSGLVDLSSEFVVLSGSKGLSKNNRLTIKSNKSADLIDYAEKTGNEPFLFIGEVIKEKNWMYCIN